MYKNITILVLGAAIVFLFYRGCNQQRVADDMQNNYQIMLEDTLFKYRNKLGQEISKSNALVFEKEKMFLNIESKDSSITKLQKLVRRYKGKLDAASVVTTFTVENETTPTVILGDTTDYSGIITEYKKVYPTYNTSWDDRWSKGTISATKDSISRNFIVKNEYEYTLGYERSGKGIKKLLSEKQPVVTIKNKNPNVSTEDVATYKMETRPKRFAFGVGAYYGYSITTLKPDLIIGGGVQLNLKRF